MKISGKNEIFQKFGFLKKNSDFHIQIVKSEWIWIIRNGWKLWLSDRTYNSSSKDGSTDAEVSATNMDSLQGTASLNFDIDKIREVVLESSDSETDIPKVTLLSCYKWHKIATNYMPPVLFFRTTVA